MLSTTVPPAIKTVETADADAARYLQFMAFCLSHAITEIQSSMTVEEGLYAAYKRYLRALVDISEAPADLRAPVESLLSELSVAFGFDADSGAKTADSVLANDRARALLARIETIAARIDERSAWCSH